MSSAETAREVAIDRERLLPGMTRQLAALRTALAGGAPRVGWKVGINVPSVQRSLGLAHAVVGWIDGRGVVPSGSAFEIAPGSMPHVEPELAIRVGDSVAASASPATGAAAIAGVAPAFEIVDYALGGAGLDDLLAHAMFHAGTVLGETQDAPSMDRAGRDWPTVARANKAAIGPSDDLVPPDLGALVAFVARYLAAFGEELRGGDTILSGSFTERAVRLEADTHVDADFGPLGVVSLRVRRKQGQSPFSQGRK